MDIQYTVPPTKTKRGGCSRTTPTHNVYCNMASITLSKLEAGTAPEINCVSPVLLLMTMLPGVPFTPAAEPPDICAFTLSRYFALERQESNCGALSPSSFAIAA